MFVGDRVDFNLGPGWSGRGTIIEVIWNDFGIRADIKGNGWHTLGGLCPKGYGVWAGKEHIVVIGALTDTTDAAAYYHALMAETNA